MKTCKSATGSKTTSVTVEEWLVKSSKPGQCTECLQTRHNIHHQPSLTALWMPDWGAVYTRYCKICIPRIHLVTLQHCTPRAWKLQSCKSGKYVDSNGERWAVALTLKKMGLANLCSLKYGICKNLRRENVKISTTEFYSISLCRFPSAKPCSTCFVP